MRILNEFVSGNVTGSASVVSTINCGFQPCRIEIIDETGLVVLKWNQGMASPSALKQVNHDTAQLSYITTGQAITVSSTGFSFLAGDTHVYYYFAC